MYKYFLYPLLLIIGIFTPLQSFSGVDFQTTLNQLSERNFSKKIKTVEAIISSKNPRTKFVLESLSKGSVYYIKSTKKVVFGLKSEKKYITKDLVNDETLGVFTKREIKKVGINNKIRQKIKIGLAVINLMDADKSIRLKAVKAIYKNLNQVLKTNQIYHV